MYCIYTDSEVPDADGNWDHIVPLSLGGLNQFTVWAKREFNSTMGSQVDGPLANDPLMALGLGRSSMKGQGKKSQPRWRNASVAGRPAEVTHTPDGMKVWDAMGRRELRDEELAGKEISARFSIGAFTALRFLAKVALGGGYFIYGDAILTAIDCVSLRKLIMLDVEAAKTDSALRACDFQICDRFHEHASRGGPLYLYRAMCEELTRSILIAEPYSNGIAFHVGIVGNFVGTLFCPGDTRAIPMEGNEQARGHVILLGPGAFERHSFEALLLDLREAIENLAASRPGQDQTPSRSK